MVALLVLTLGAGWEAGATTDLGLPLFDCGGAFRVLCGVAALSGNWLVVALRRFRDYDCKNVPRKRRRART